jgi:DNA-binding GntR family transcriptional regulator
LDAHIGVQRDAIESKKTDNFHLLDYEFHKMVCDFAGFALAFDTIQTCKQSVDRLCVLSLRKKREGTAVIDDHQELADALAAGSSERARAATEKHLARLDSTIEEIHEAHANYFE